VLRSRIAVGQSLYLALYAALLGAALLGAALLGAALLGACSGEPAPTDGQAEGKRLGQALTQHIETSMELRAPFRCARFPTDARGPNMERVSWDDTSGALVVKPYGSEPRFATIADARASSATDVSALERLRDSLNEQDVDVLISLGGLGRDEESIEQVLKALTMGARYLVLAFPGALESLPAHRSAIASLAKNGVRILDATRYRFTQLGELRLATMPGIAKTAHLVAGDSGCVHIEADIEELLANLAIASRPTVLLSYAPWRQQGDEATDLGIGDIHAGELELSPLERSEHVSALVHGMLSSREMANDGSIRLAQPPASIPTGSLSQDAASPSALMLSVAGAKLSWKRLPVH
tara:strand:- start:68815 stop:69873 length:1059 start_codon:yes stop_codon:yes gene_type:complete